MTNTFIISDTHFSHYNSWAKFTRSDGVTPLRPFSSNEEMDEALVENWNKVVGPNDKVYHLGDVAIAKRALTILGRLNGRKVLVKGNHDVAKLQHFTEYFADIRGVHYTNDVIMSHIPVHTSCVDRFKANVHGHLHANYINDPRYLCVSVEHINYTPISYDDVLDRLAKNREAFEATGSVIDWSDVTLRQYKVGQND